MTYESFKNVLDVVSGVVAGAVTIGGVVVSSMFYVINVKLTSLLVKVDAELIVLRNNINADISDIKKRIDAVEHWIRREEGRNDK